MQVAMAVTSEREDQREKKLLDFSVRFVLYNLDPYLSFFYLTIFLLHYFLLFTLHSLLLSGVLPLALFTSILPFKLGSGKHQTLPAWT